MLLIVSTILNVIAVLGITHVIVDKWSLLKCRFCVAFFLALLSTTLAYDNITSMQEVNKILIMGFASGFLAFFVGTITDYLQSNSAIE
jgi:hypothetical protein